MDAWKYVLGNMKFISRVEQDISLVRFAHSWDILVNTRNKFHISMYYSLFNTSIAQISNENMQIRTIFIIEKFSHFRKFLVVPESDDLIYKQELLKGR